MNTTLPIALPITLPTTRRHRPPRSRRMTALCTVLAVMVSACGGGGGGTSGPTGGGGVTGQPDGAGTPGTPAPAPVTTVATALGSSARTVSIGWKPVAGTGGYRIERAANGQDWSALAELPDAAAQFVDSGLAPEHAYRYRLLARTDGHVMAEAAATTGAGTDQPLLTAVAASAGELLRSTVGPQGGRVATPDGSVAIEVPPGAFESPAELVLSRIGNTAPGGRGDGLALAVNQVPALPLVLQMSPPADRGEAASDSGLALQQADGSWLSLPVTGRDGAAVRAALPPGLSFGASPATALRATASAAGSASNGGIVAHVVRYERLYLSPQTASVPVDGRVVLTPYARTRVHVDDCDDKPEGDLCVPVPVLEPREVPLLNSKPGYRREWLVQDQVGGTPALGTIVASPGGPGASYVTPARKPSPNPVTVTFRSTHERSGRTLALQAQVTVTEPYWTGTARGTLGTAGGDIGFSFAADAIWSLPPEGSIIDTYTAQGSQLVSVVNVSCTASATPSTTSLPPGALVIDRSTEPPTYALDVGSLWNTVITGTCPGHPGPSSVPMTVPGRLQVNGTVTANGRRIEGQARLNNIDWVWALERHE